MNRSLVIVGLVVVIGAATATAVRMDSRNDPPAGAGASSSGILEPRITVPGPTAEQETGQAPLRERRPQDVLRDASAPKGSVQRQAIGRRGSRSRPTGSPTVMSPSRATPGPAPAQTSNGDQAATPRVSSRTRATPVGRGDTEPGEPASAPVDVPTAGTSSTPRGAPAPEAAPPAAGTPGGALSDDGRQPPRSPVLTPPIPVSLDPPRHPLAWRAVVEPPDLAAQTSAAPTSARVRLRLLVRADGTVGRVEIATSSGHGDLDAAAAQAAGRWRFSPARRDGVPIESRVLIWIAFVPEP